MMQKFEKVLDLAIEALEMYLGRSGRVDVTAAPVKETKTRAPRKAAATPPPAETATASPFHVDSELKNTGVAPKLGPDDVLEAKRRGQEVMGLFIRRYLKAAPTGLDRAKKIINDTLGGPRAPKAAWQLEDITAEDWLKLTPIFETELDKA